MAKSTPWEFLQGLPWWGKAIGVLMYTVLYPVTLVIRLLTFGRLTDRETFYDRLRDRIFRG